ncbi:nucleotidyltransferase family protein [Candidatus Woesearchaeota archaeon]|nr:nucleotidyltransferase family protein [Candidatus Woesearchaeota archaeon]
MKLFINTGGKGTRLYPLTKDIPKPMVNICGKPILHYLVDWAKNNNIKEIIMMNGYKAEKVIEYFKDGKEFEIDIKHSNEPQPLGSGGAIKFAKNYIDETFVYISGDLLCDIDLKKIIKFHKENKGDMTITLFQTDHPHDSDIIKIDKNNKVIKFISKHDNHAGAGNLSNSGLCIIEPKIIELMDKEIFTFETEIYPKAIEKNLRILGYVTNEFIEDMGTPERFKKCEEYFKSK